MDPLVVGEKLTKSYGPTIAVNSVSFAIRRGAITALLGGNGAGKSTLTRLLSGGARPDDGKLVFDSHPISFADYSVRKAKDLGIRVVHQELSVCTNLNAAENFFLELSELFPGGRPWRRKAGELVERTLETIFPKNRIRATSNVGSLSLAQQQMVEIARAAADPKLKLLILDEPTSSLDATRAHQLLEYLRRRAQQGLSFVFIGHKLGEILDLAEDFLVIRDGRLVWGGPRAETDHEKLVTLLSAKTPSGEKAEARPAVALQTCDRAPSTPGEAPLVEIAGSWRENSALGAVKLFRGDIIGLAGLEGSGQEPLLLGIYAASRRPEAKIIRRAQVAYVAGDRQKEGVFPLWTTMQNMTIARQARRSGLQPVSVQAEKEWTAPWGDRFSFTASAMERLILQVVAAIGLCVGWVNALIVNRLRIPPIIATLAVGYILTTATLIFNRGFKTYAVSPMLAYVASARVFGVPIILLLALVLTWATAWLIHSSVYGRKLSAVGQNRRAAHFAGIRVEATTRTAYMLSGLLAALGGALLSGRVSGAFLEMGTPYLLQSVGAVVVGGSSILGGRGNAFGTLLGSIFLVMIVTTMQVLRVASGSQDIVEGMLIILVLAVATVRTSAPKKA